MIIPEKISFVSSQLSLEQVRIAERPPEDTPMVRLQINVANSLKSALAKLKAAQGKETCKILFSSSWGRAFFYPNVFFKNSCNLLYFK